MEKYIAKMTEKIENSPYGSAFAVSDFTDEMSYETAKKNISRLEKKGMLRRVIRGVYDKPQYSTLLGEYAAPDPTVIAQALARNFNWNIAPSGETALNLLGLSTQVPANWKYISSGPYRDYSIGQINLEFVHRNDRTISGMSWKTAMVIEALKGIGIEEITDQIIDQIRNLLSVEDKRVLLKEGGTSLSKVYNLISRFSEDIDLILDWR